MGTRHWYELVQRNYLQEELHDLNAQRSWAAEPDQKELKYAARKLTTGDAPPRLRPQPSCDSTKRT